MSSPTLKDRLTTVLAFDRRSMAVFRMGLALVVMADLIGRSRSLTAHYTDAGVLPRPVVIEQLLHPLYWSFHLLSGSVWWQIFLFVLAFAVAVALLIGYRTRLATIALWALTISLQHRAPVLLFAGDDVLRAVLFWSMFLPLGSCYSVDSALNNAPKPLSKRLVSGATFAFMIQLCFIYIWSAAYKTKSPIWFPDGDAVYYSVHFEQYARNLALFLANFPQEILRLMTYSTLLFEWLGSLLIFIPFWNWGFRCIAIASFTLLHLVFGLTFELGIFSYLSIVNWFILIPTEIWDRLEKRISIAERAGLTVYYDADCGFCKKVVYFIRTLAILPHTPLLEAQSQEDICEEMQRINSWVVVDYQGNHHHKFEAIAYVCSISPILWALAPLLRWKPLMKVGTKFYETIATNRKTAGILTRPFKFRPLRDKDPAFLNVIILGLLFLTTLWNLRGFVTQTVLRRQEQPKDFATQTYKLFNRRTFQKIHNIGYLTRLDQVWSIFAPNPPRFDGWHVIVGTLKDGTEVNVLQEDKPIRWEKLTPTQRYEIYPNMQWRIFFIKIQGLDSKILMPPFADYLCRNWNRNHPSERQLERLTIYFMDEQTVPPNEVQTVEKKRMFDQSCQ